MDYIQAENYLLNSGDKRIFVNLYAKGGAFLWLVVHDDTNLQIIKDLQSLNASKKENSILVSTEKFGVLGLPVTEKNQFVLLPGPASSLGQKEGEERPEPPQHPLPDGVWIVPMAPGDFDKLYLNPGSLPENNTPICAYPGSGNPIASAYSLNHYKEYSLPSSSYTHK